MSNEQSMAEQIKADSAQRGEDRRLSDAQAMEIELLREQVRKALAANEQLNATVGGYMADSARLRDVALALGKRAADTFSDLVESNEDRERLRKELQEQEELTAGWYAKFEGCPHAQQQIALCGCSFDRKDDVCALHAPQLREATTEIARLREQVRVLRDALQSLMPEVCGWLGLYGGNTNIAAMKDKVQAARAALASTEPRP